MLDIKNKSKKLSLNWRSGLQQASELAALEPRIMLDAAAPATAEAALASADNTAQNNTADQDIADAPAVSEHRRSEVILIDSDIEDYDVLLDDLLNDAEEVIWHEAGEGAPTVTVIAENRVVEVYAVSGSEEGFAGFTEILQSQQGLDAIHIITHGEEAELHMGDERISAQNIDSYGAQLEVWGEALGAGGDILLYGCQVGDSEAGVSFIERFAELTDADIAASDDDTGAASRGGDWDLEFSTGLVAADSLSAQSWGKLLGGTATDTDGDGIADSVDIDDDNDGILDTEEGSGNNNAQDSGADGAIPAGNISFGISSTSPTTVGNPHFLDTITISGVNATVDGTYSDFIVPSSYESNYNETAGLQVQEALNAGHVADRFGNPNWDQDVLDAFQSRNLQHFQQQDGHDFTDDSYTLNYNTPVLSTVGTFLTIVEREGNNVMFLEAFDPNGNPIGTLTVNIADYVDTGHQANNGQTHHIATFPLDDIAPVGTSIGSIRVTFPGSVTDGPDGKVFIFGDSAQADTDQDGIVNGCDLDSDNDGISDMFESGASAAILAADTNNDGTISLAEAAAANGGVADADGDGLMDIFDQDVTNGSEVASEGTQPVDTDNDGVADFLDLDSDNDGILDAVESQLTQNFAANFSNDGDVRDNDADSDGVIDIYDSNDGSGIFGGTFNTPVDTDGDGNPDFLDLDSDNDTLTDTVESGLSVIISGLDADGDGADDAIAPDSYLDPNGVINVPDFDLANQTGDDTEVGYRELNDKDGDGIADDVDLDDDNDGILDINEGASVTATASGVSGAFSSTEVTYNILSLSPPTQGEPHILESITISGVNSTLDGTYTEIIVPTSYESNFNENGLTQVQEALNSGHVGDKFTDPNWDQNVLDAFQDRNLQHFQQLDSGDNTDDSYTLHYANPVTSTAGAFLMISERSGNNIIVLEAFDQNGNAIGTLTVNPADYIDTNHQANNSQTIKLATFPLDDLAPPGSEIASIRVSFPNSPIDGPDGKIFIVGNSLTLSGGTDTDKDGIANFCDLDSDNDGISDLYESGASAAVIAADTNRDGTISLAEAAAANGGVADADGDGLMDIFDADTSDTSAAASVGTVPVNTDNDAVADFLDLDSDNDGIADTIEARPTAGYAANADPAGDNDVSNDDADGDGVIALFDSNDGGSGVFGGTHPNFNAPEDTDGDGVADYLDQDSDNDGRSDTLESGLQGILTPDLDGDGISDALNAGYCDPDGDINDPSNDLANEFGDNSEVGYREVGADINLDKVVSSVAPAASGTAGNFDVTYTFTVTNTGVEQLDNLNLTDDFASQFGGNFVAVASAPVVSNINATQAPAGNANYAGTTGNMLDGTGLLETGQSFEVTVTIEVDPDADIAAHVNGELENQANIQGSTPAGTLVDDDSDDTNDPTNIDPDMDGNPDDPTLVGFSAIGLTKEGSDPVPASSGIEGNFDVTYTFVVTNTGSADLNNLVLSDDWSGQFGSAFVGTVGNVTVTNISAASVPGANPAYTGAPGENMLDGSGVLQSGQSFQVEVTIEVDPDAPGAILSPDDELVNTATVQGTDPDGTPVNDDSDDPTDPTDTDNDGDNEPDDPTVVVFPPLEPPPAANPLFMTIDARESIPYPDIHEPILEYEAYPGWFHGRLISLETMQSDANLVGARSEMAFDQSFSGWHANLYPKPWNQYVGDFAESVETMAEPALWRGIDFNEVQGRLCSDEILNQLDVYEDWKDFYRLDAEGSIEALGDQIEAFERIIELREVENTDDRGASLFEDANPQFDRDKEKLALINMFEQASG